MGPCRAGMQDPSRGRARTTYPAEPAPVCQGDAAGTPGSGRGPHEGSPLPPFHPLAVPRRSAQGEGAAHQHDSLVTRLSQPPRGQTSAGQVRRPELRAGLGVRDTPHPDGGAARPRNTDRWPPGPSRRTPGGVCGGPPHLPHGFPPGSNQETARPQRCRRGRLPKPALGITRQGGDCPRRKATGRRDIPVAPGPTSRPDI